MAAGERDQKHVAAKGGAPPASAPPPPAETRLAGEPAAKPPQARLAPGSVLFGEYEILGVLGAGGMGEVYRARHRRLDEFRAIKVMHANFAADAAVAELFDREAKALLAVRHPAVVSCHDLLSDEQGSVYLVMEMVEGTPLSELLARGPLSEREVKALGARVAEGLAAAHERGVIHRDLSPDNIVLPGDDPARAKLIDFGIAKLLEAGPGTILDAFKGKLGYASPEQLGFFGGVIDGRSDCYSLGLVLCAAAIGRPLDMGRTFAEAVDARRRLTEVPPDVPVSLHRYIEPLIRLDPADRPSSAQALFADSDERGPKERGRRALPLGWLAAAGALVLAGVVGGMVLRGGEEPAGPASTTAAARPSPAGTDLTPTASERVQRPSPSEPVQPSVPVPSEGAVRKVEPQGEATKVPEVVSKPAPKAADRAAALRRELRIVGMLKGAERALEDGRLTTPAGDNAFERYRAVLELSPGNRAALEGIRKLGDRYLALARESQESGDLDQAESYLASAARVTPDHPELAAMRRRLRDTRE